MNGFLLVANILTFLAFVIHTFVGDRELKVILPKIDPNDFDPLEKWTMARCGWHWVSVDLLFASILLVLINFSNYFEQEQIILKLLSIYFIAYAVIWFFTILISKSFPKNFLKLGQWVLLIIIAVLLILGNN
jgi:uncharacterized membrane protein YfcA